MPHQHGRVQGHFEGVGQWVGILWLDDEQLFDLVLLSRRYKLVLEERNGQMNDMMNQMKTAHEQVQIQ